MRTYEYRLYPHKAQRIALMQCLMESRHLYNEMVTTVKQQYEDKGTFPTKYDLTAQYIRVSPHFTSQRCFQCGEMVQKSLSVRTHRCPHCGYVADRDVNAAQNILSKAGAPPSGANVHQ